MTMPPSLRLKKSNVDQVKNENVFPPSLKLKSKKQQEIDQEKPNFETDEDLERDIERNQARTTSRIGEAILGAPGDIASFITGLFGKEQNILPTSQKLKGLSEKASQGYTKPQTEFEKSADEIASDIGSMAIPGSGHYSFARNLGIPVVGSLVKEGLKYSNSSEKTQAYGKVGTMIALDLLSRRSGGVKGYVDSLYKKAEESLPNGVSVKATNLERALDKLQNSLSEGGKRNSTTKALEKVEEIRKEIKSNGKIDVKKLAAYRPSINEAIEDLGGFQKEVSFKYKPAAIRNLNQVKSEVINTLEEYGKKFNPEFIKSWHAANESFGAMKQSNFIANLIAKKIPYSPKSKSVQTLFSLVPTGAAFALSRLTPAAGAGAVAGVGIYNTAKILHRVIKSPVLRKYYFNTIKSAAAGNIPQTTKNLKALDLNFREHDQD